jgi:ribosomal protein S18 acetylase RimI-like enzyme
LRTENETWRAGTPDDVEAIGALVEAAYAKWIPLIGRRPLPMVADYHSTINEHDFTLVERDGALIGLIETEARSDHLYIVNVAVAVDRQGLGLGRRLIAHAERQALAQGFDEIRLITNARFAANVALYERVGYEVIWREPVLSGEAAHMRKQLEGS